MNWTKAVAMTLRYGAVFAMGCVNEAYPSDDPAVLEIGSEVWQEWQHLPLSASPDEDVGGDDGGDDGGDLDKEAAQVVGVETLNVTVPASMHAQGLALPAKLVRPKWSKPVGEQPAMMVLHGSGGLLKNAKKGDKGSCSDEMESQFATWSKRLAERGYTVLLPSSYSARGFCDKHDDAGKMPKTFDDNPEQILGRLYDVDAAARWLCDRPEVDCERMGLLGFSQGATMVMVALHWQIDQALSYFRSTKGNTVDISIPDVKPGRPDFQVGVAYYPGCGFDGVVPLSTSSSAKIENKFFATAPLFVLHASEDSLLDHCSAEYGKGGREIQSGQVASKIKLTDTYDITVYPNAGHSFDSAGDKAKGGTAKGNLDAQKKALAVTLEKLDLHLKN